MGGAGLTVRAAARLADYLRLVRFEHSVFALPFVLIAAFAAAGGLPTGRRLLWIVVATVSGRTAAMAFNRLADRRLDALNPRTADRELPTGRVSLAAAAALTVGAAAAFVFAAAQLNRLCLYLSFPALAWLLGYSYTKRFTALSHAWLGAALGLGPLGAWLALRARWELAPTVLAGGVLCWVAGFDIVYSLLDEGFDRRTGLHSAIVRLGRRRALHLARLLHAAFVAAVGLFGLLSGLGPGLYLALAGVVAALAYEHAIVDPDEPSRVNTAFFTMNGIVSFALLAGACVDIFLLRPA